MPARYARLTTAPEPSLLTSRYFGAGIVGEPLTLFRHVDPDPELELSLLRSTRASRMLPEVVAQSEDVGVVYTRKGQKVSSIQRQKLEPNAGLLALVLSSIG